MRVEVGDKSFEALAALAYMTDDAKTGLAVTSLAFYPSADVTCDQAGRAISDNAGGFQGIQFETSAIAFSATSIMSP